MTISECTQTRCAFNRSHGEQAASICPVCSDCGCESNVIDDNCVNCWNCLSDEGYLRAGVPKFIKDAVKKKIMKDITIELRR